MEPAVYDAGEIFLLRLVIFRERQDAVIILHIPEKSEPSKRRARHVRHVVREGQRNVRAYRVINDVHASVFGHQADTVGQRVDEFLVARRVEDEVAVVIQHRQLARAYPEIREPEVDVCRDAEAILISLVLAVSVQVGDPGADVFAESVIGPLPVSDKLIRRGQSEVCLLYTSLLCQPDVRKRKREHR